MSKLRSDAGGGLRVAVVGVGHLGIIHARLLAQVEGAELAAVVDPSEPARTAAAAELRVPAHADHAPLLGQIDAAIVAAPTRHHHAASHDLLSHGIHVFVEKPMTLNVGDADDLIATASEHDCVLQVGHVERFNPGFLAAAPHIQSPKYIDAARTSAYACRSTDIGVVLDLMIHDIDAILALVREDVTAVEALGAAVIGPNEDWAQARLTFAGGCVANLTASRVAWQPQRSMHIVCRDCMAAIDFGSRTAKLMRPSTAVLAGELDVNALSAEERARVKAHLFSDYLPLIDLPAAESNALLQEQREFVAAIRGERPVRVTGVDGRRALDVAERILAQIATHRWGASADGPIGPRFETRRATLRGPHWSHQGAAVTRRLAG
ncbi:MAG TPA: Gfo/Idh/MocA family oxidoreductase [Pirellulaceae bacterium]|nr:Gfo/Idh/MocA family oxidoreductase [Pirellulaceae bacterium]